MAQLKSVQANESESDFLPDLCNVQAVFALVLVGELLAFAFTVIDRGLTQFSWLTFGAQSFLIQWIILCSAGLLCPLRPWLRRQHAMLAGTVCYLLVLTITGVFSSVGWWFSGGVLRPSSMQIVDNLVIAAIFAGVVLRYFYLQQQLHNREQAELRSRIQALQSRIRPHFLFNSMNSIASLIDIDPRAAEQMVVDLSQLFRASLSDRALVPLDEEIALCQQFVSIENTRLGNRLAVDWSLSVPETDASLVPSLLVQPLLENAIYHGIQPLAEGGTVAVSIVQDSDNVRIKVHNPVTPDPSRQAQMRNGMALENIRHRLAALFGDGATMTAGLENDQFSVHIAYPVTSTPSTQ